VDPIVKIKQVALLLGDAALFYFSLLLTLFIRYQGLDKEIVTIHFWPFTIVMAVWLLIFYIAGFYDLRALKNDPIFARNFAAVLSVNGVLAIIIFYLIPAFGITPKTNLFILLVIYSLSLFIWRAVFNNILSAGRPINKILLVGYTQAAEGLVNKIGQNPQLGYEIKFWMKEGLQDKEFDHLAQIIVANGINMIVVPAHIKKNSKAAKLIYKNLLLGIEVVNLADLYEQIFLKVPITELEEVWFLENIAKQRKVYEFFKRPIEIVLAAMLAVFFLPFMILISLLTTLTSRGPVIYSQKRIGQNGSEFMIYKFRTMAADAEKDGPKWAASKDKRSTPFGALLRRTHLDELPQFINILKGELSLVGPRPERPEFVASLKKEIPFYELRQLVRSGITGWAQINYRYGASIEDAYEKLQYDLYYLKNRSLVLDIIILIKTIRYFFVTLR
jgi:exopolysaccharide biosynthesis polyprenyl glycosylphosphotransferase